jgi:hypothetical protein
MVGERYEFLEDYDFECECGRRGPWTLQAVEQGALRDCPGRCGRIYAQVRADSNGQRVGLVQVVGEPGKKLKHWLPKRS